MPPPIPAQETREHIRESLRNKLAEGASAGAVRSFALPLAGIDPVDWLSAQRLFPKIYWQARGEGRAYAAVGSALVLSGTTQGDEPWSGVQRVVRENPALMFFGGMRFDPRGPAGDEWKDFGACTFVLPRFVVEQDGDRTALRCTVQTTDSTPFESVFEEVAREVADLVFDAPQLVGNAVAKTTWHEQPTREEWLRNVEHVTGRIAEGGLDKLVLARRGDVTFAQPPDAFAFIRDFRAMKSPAYFFCIQPTRHSAFVGSSPEQLFKRTGNRVSSEALAGTRPRGATSNEDDVLAESLLRSVKDRREHALVHEHVQRALHPLCEDLSDDGSLRAFKLVLVQHLLQQMSGTLKAGVSDATLVRRLHPTPAVGGVPADKALALIRELEPFDRGWYAAPVGVIGRDHVDFTVAIRSGLVHDRTLSLYCGAGIVEGSEPLVEWEETESKFANFLRVIHAG